jgi:hypothetical protein
MKRCYMSFLLNEVVLVFIVKPSHWMNACCFVFIVKLSYRMNACCFVFIVKPSYWMNACCFVFIKPSYWMNACCFVFFVNLSYWMNSWHIVTSVTGFLSWRVECIFRRTQRFNFRNMFCCFLNTFCTLGCFAVLLFVFLHLSTLGICFVVKNNLYLLLFCRVLVFFLDVSNLEICLLSFKKQIIHWKSNSNFGLNF